MKNPGTIYLGRINPQNERHQQDCVFDCNGSSPTISAGETLGRYLTRVEVTNMADQNTIELPSELKGKKFRIRKLTPTECLRLMGCDEPTIRTMSNCGLSNSALYKLAGNSIVVDVLFHIFRRMFIETDIDIDCSKPQQLELF